jgi:hypothetical protein
VPQTAETAQVGSSRIESLKEAGQSRLTGYSAHPEQLWHDRIAAQIGHVGELARVTQQVMDKGQSFLDRQQMIVRYGQGVRQNPPQRLDPLAAP